MLDKNYIAIYSVLAFLSIGFIILGSVVFKNQEYYSVQSKSSLLRENENEWKRGPYSKDTTHKLKFTLFNIKNPFSLLTSDKLEVIEKENNVEITENLEYEELSRKPYKHTEILNLKVKNNREFSVKNDVPISNDDNLTLIKTGSFVYWNYIKNSPKGSNFIMRMYKQLKEIEKEYFIYVKLKAKTKITSLESFKKSILFNGVEISDEIKEIMYNKVKMSFINDASFEKSLLQCNDVKVYEQLYKRRETLYTWDNLFQRCSLFKQLFNLNQDTFKKLSENYKLFVQNELNINVDKYEFAREQWGRGKYINSFFLNNSTHLYGKELHAFNDKANLDGSVVDRLIDYYFVHENDNNKNYIAPEYLKSVLFNKGFLDSFYQDNEIKFPISELTNDQANILKNYLKSIYDQDTNNNDREIFELSEFFTDRIYYFATKLGYELFVNILSNQALNEYFSKKTCLENIDFIENKEELKKICTEYKDFKELKEVNKMLLGILYEKNSVIEFLESTITNIDQRNKFIQEMKKIYVSYIADINTKYIKDEKCDSKYFINGHYKELNFNKFGLSQFFFSEYPAYTSFKSFSDIEELTNVSEFTKFCEKLKKENPLTKSEVENKADFSGLFSIGFIYNSLKQRGDKTGFTSDTFVDYIKEIYIQLKLSGLTRTVSKDTIKEELEFGYIDDLLKSFDSKSILLGGNKIAYNNQYFDYDNLVGDRVSFYSGFNNTAISRFYYSTNGLNSLEEEDTMANKILYKNLYYPGNNEPIKYNYEPLNNEFISRSDLNCSDLYKFSPQIERKNLIHKDLNTQDECIFIPELFSKVYLNRTKDMKLVTYLNAEEFKLNFTKIYIRSNDHQLIDLSQVYKYGLAASKKYYVESKDIFNTVNFYKSDQDTPLTKEEMEKDESLDSLMTIESSIGLNVKTNLNIMYSLNIKKDTLFVNDKIIPLYFKQKSFDFVSSDIHNNFTSIRGNSFGFKLFDFIGVGLLLFSLMAIVYIVFKPAEKEENNQVKYQNSLVSTYGALGEDIESNDKKDDTYFSNKELLNKTEVTKTDESN